MPVHCGCTPATSARSASTAAQFQQHPRRTGGRAAPSASGQVADLHPGARWPAGSASPGSPSVCTRRPSVMPGSTVSPHSGSQRHAVQLALWATVAGEPRRGSDVMVDCCIHDRPEAEQKHAQYGAGAGDVVLDRHDQFAVVALPARAGGRRSRRRPRGRRSLRRHRARRPRRCAPCRRRSGSSDGRRRRQVPPVDDEVPASTPSTSRAVSAGLAICAVGMPLPSTPIAVRHHPRRDAGGQRGSDGLDVAGVRDRSRRSVISSRAVSAGPSPPPPRTPNSCPAPRARAPLPGPGGRRSKSPDHRGGVQAFDEHLVRERQRRQRDRW